jgi:fatty-acyl-CoA synthase
MTHMQTASYVHGASTTPLLGQTVGACFDDCAVRFPDIDALIVPHQDIRWTYAELKGKVDALAAGLIALGLEPGERVGI